MDKEYIKLDHRYVLELDQKELFDTIRDNLPSCLQFLQDKGHLKGYSLDNAASLGDKAEGFVRGRLCYRTDIHINIYELMKELEEGENTNDRK